MRHALAAILLAGSITVPALAQDIPEITVRPLDDGRGDGAYVGPYGRNLPGVSMFSGRSVPVSTPLFADGGVPIPSRRQISNEYTYTNRPLPPLDAWHGTLGSGIPF